MKKIFLAILSVALALSCTKGEDTYKRATIDFAQGTLVPGGVLTPTEGETIGLDDYTPVDFTWSAAKWDGIGFPTYEIDVIREGGDFASPLAVFHCGSVKDLKWTLSRESALSLYKSAALDEREKSLSFEWCITSVAGGKKVPSTAKGSFTMNKTPDPIVTYMSGDEVLMTVTVPFRTAATKPANPTRPRYAFDAWYSDKELTTAFDFSTILLADTTLFAGWDEAPDAFVAGNDIFLVSAGSRDDGRKFTYIPGIDYHADKAISAHYNDNAPRIKDFDYEIFAELKSGTPLFFWSGMSTGDKDWYFVPNTENAVNADNASPVIKKKASFGATVSADGIYRIRLKSSTGEIYIKKINSVVLRHWAAATDVDMTYQGNGVWTLDLNLGAAKKGFKFLFKGLDADQPYGEEYPTSAVGSENYFKVITVQGGAADGNRGNGTWTVPAECAGKLSTYTLSMNGDGGAYLVSWKVK